MTYRNHYENLTSALQKLCYLSETTLRNAKPPSFVPRGGLFGFNGLFLPAHRQKARTAAEKNQAVTCAVLGEPLFLEILTTFWIPTLYIH